MDQLFEKHKLLWLALIGMVVCASVFSLFVGVNWVLLFLKKL